jgi:Zn finger protein HypA/HybF involved in hydrogenase expression
MGQGTSYVPSSENMSYYIPQVKSGHCPVCGTAFSFLCWSMFESAWSPLYRHNLRCPRCYSVAKAVYEYDGGVELKQSSKSNHQDPAIKCPSCGSPWEGWRTPMNSLATINGAIRIKKNLYECPECHTQTTVK